MSGRRRKRYRTSFNDIRIHGIETENMESHSALRQAGGIATMVNGKGSGQDPGNVHKAIHEKYIILRETSVSIIFFISPGAAQMSF